MTQSVEVAARDRTGAAEVASVVLTVPAHRDYVVIIRSAVAQLAGCFGFTVREIADLRLAVNEACALLVTGAPGRDQRSADSITCRAEVRGDRVRVTVTAPVGSFGAPDTDSFGWNLMTALVDSLAWAQDGLTARVDLEKRRGIPIDVLTG